MTTSVRVVAVTGAPGVGKTAVGARLGRLLPGPTATIDIDGLANVWPWRHDDALLDLQADNLLQVLPRLIAWGARTVVVSGVILPGRLLPRIHALITDPSLDWGWYGLRACPETLALRIGAFRGVQDPQLRSSMAALDVEVSAVPDVVEIVTDELSLDEVVAEISRHEKNRAVACPPHMLPHVVAVGEADARQWAVTALTSRGVDRRAAGELVTRLIDAERDGAPSHGLLRIPEYCGALDRGEIDAAARPPVSRAGQAWAVDGARVGGWRTFTTVSGLLLTAAEQGVAVVRVARGGHLGRLGDLVRPAAAAGLIVLGFATYSGTGQKVAAAGTAQGSLATNPVVLGFPADASPIVVDVTTSAWSEGAVRVAAETGGILPDGVMIDRFGRWVHDPTELYRADAFDRVALATLGRGVDGADHKGFALAVIVELLGGAIGGDAVCEQPAFDGQGGNSALFIAAAPELLGHTVSGLCDHATRLEHYLATKAPLDADNPVRLPGRARSLQHDELLSLPVNLASRLRDLAGAP